MAPSTHLMQQPKPTDPLDASTKSVRLTWHSNQICQTHFTQQPNLSDSLDATPPFNSENSHLHHYRYIVRSPIHRLTGGGVL
ncbi:hypothetical protein TNCV_28171 [Trichonephila clavipes]|uniref:Uncharacterized protein n=1 Tax=Trichonephila clavipes TaxID=2585209 RepID=A0A8X6WLC7_TRICX|nr:hypothetical protein TNCV_28171 [Trichonephila clavipes]